MRRTVLAVLLVLLVASPRYTVPIGDFPGLQELINKADAVVILRIDRHINPHTDSNLLSTHECFIYQTLKGEIPPEKTIQLRLMDTRTSFSTPFALWSTHLMFLTKKRTPDEPTEYRTIEFQGANVRLAPLGHENNPEGNTVAEQVRSVLKRSLKQSKKAHAAELAFLHKMIGERDTAADDSKTAPAKVQTSDSEAGSLQDTAKMTASLVGRVLYHGTPPEQRQLRIPLRVGYWREGRQVFTEELPERRQIQERGVPDESLVVGRDGGVANVVVWVRSKNVPPPPYRESGPAVMRAVDGRFAPHVLAFWIAAPLKLINESGHSINFNWRGPSIAQNRVLSEGQSIDIKVKKPASIPSQVTSNIHPWYNAHILPVAHPYFAVTNTDGRFEIKNMPPGEWEFAIWHERTGWLENDRFPTGRFTWIVRPSENALGDLLVDPTTFAEQDGATSDTAPAVDASEAARISVAPRRDPYANIIPLLPTLQAARDKAKLHEQIEKALAEVRRRDGGHVVVGRVHVEDGHDPRDVNAQMMILEGGYFADVTKDLERPVGFRMHGYAPFDVQLAGRRGPIVDVGTIQLKRLPEPELVPVAGRILLEDDGDLGSVSLRLSAKNGPVNTPSNGTDPRSSWPHPITVPLTAGGWFYQRGFSPIEYHLAIDAPGYVKQSRSLTLEPERINDVGTIKLERPRRIAIDYIIADNNGFDAGQLRQTVLQGGDRWQIWPRNGRWDLEFDQVAGQLRFDWTYGPVYLADLGIGELDDFLNIEPSTAQTQPRGVAATNGHVYLFRSWTRGGDSNERLVLFRIRPDVDSETPPAAIDRLDERGFSQLHRAATGGHVERVRQLLADGANVDVRQAKFRGTPLQYAAKQGHGATVQTLLDNGASVDARDSHDRTPLIWAAMGGHSDVIERLLDAGADINAEGSGGWTPLHFVADRGHGEAAQLLIDRGANPLARNSHGKTPADLNPDLQLQVPWKMLRE